jgi:hypothetical protein
MLQYLDSNNSLYRERGCWILILENSCAAEEPAISLVVGCLERNFEMGLKTSLKPARGFRVVAVREVRNDVEFNCAWCHCCDDMIVWYE